MDKKFDTQSKASQSCVTRPEINPPSLKGFGLDVTMAQILAANNLGWESLWAPRVPEFLSEAECRELAHRVPGITVRRRK